MNPGVLIYSRAPFMGSQLAGRISSGHDVAGSLQALALQLQDNNTSSIILTTILMQLKLDVV